MQTEPIYEKCECCGHRKSIIKDVEYCCDNCGSPMEIGKDGTLLTIGVFNKDKATINYEFCSWKCVIEKLKTLESDYFINLPYLSFDTDISGCSAKDFLSLLK